MRIFVIFLLVSCFFFSCEKEDEKNAVPIISIVSPIANQYFSVGDTIYIQGSVSDDRLVKNVNISLKDDNNISVGNAVSIAVNSPSYTLNQKFVIDNYQIDSGIYSLMITAYDENNNSSTKFIDLNINEYPKVRNGFVLFGNNSSSTNIVLLDSLLNPSSSFNVSGDFLDGIVNSTNQEIISCGNISGDLRAYNINAGSLAWSVTNNFSGQAHFTGLSNFENNTFLGFFNQNIQSYLKAGIPYLNFQALANHYPQKMVVHNNDLLLTEQKNKTTADVKIVAYYYSTSIEKQNVNINEDVVGMFSFSANNVVVFSNTAGNGKIQIFDINQNSLWQPFSLNIGEIEDCTEIANGIYIIIQNGDLYQVNFNNYTKTLFLGSINATKVKYDNLNNQLGVVSGNEFSLYDYSSKTKMTSYINSEAILTFDFWYNK